MKRSFPEHVAPCSLTGDQKFRQRAHKKKEGQNMELRNNNIYNFFHNCWNFLILIGFKH